MRVSLLLASALGALLVASLAGLIILSGHLRALTAGPLLAEVTLHDFVAPSSFRVDRNELTAGLLRQIEARAGADVGLRMALDDLGRKQLSELIIPRLINPSVVARVIDDVAALGAILGIDDYRSVAEVTVSNRSDTALADVVFMLPALVRGEDDTGAELAITKTSTGLTGLRLEHLAPHESVSWRVWMNAPAAEVQAGPAALRLGAANGLDGQVHLFGAPSRLTGDLETVPWSRWVLGFIVAITALSAFVALAMMSALALSRRRSA